MVCTTFYNVITNAEYKQQYTGALDNMIEEKNQRRRVGSAHLGIIVTNTTHITHRLKKTTTIDGYAGRIQHPRKKKRVVTNMNLF